MVGVVYQLIMTDMGSNAHSISGCVGKTHHRHTTHLCHILLSLQDSMSSHQLIFKPLTSNHTWHPPRGGGVQFCSTLEQTQVLNDWWHCQLALSSS